MLVSKVRGRVSQEKGCRNMNLSCRRFAGAAGLFALTLLALPCLADNQTPGKKLYLVVTREKFTQAANPLVEKRRAEGFEVVVSTAPPADVPWKGVIDREGTLRLVAFTPEELHVAALCLKLPTTRPAAGN